MGPRGKGQRRVRQVQEEAQSALQQPWGPEQVVSLAQFATGQQAGLTWECGRVSLYPLSCPKFIQAQHPYRAKPL